MADLEDEEWETISDAEEVSVIEKPKLKVKKQIGKNKKITEHA